MFKYLNRGIPVPLAIGIIVIVLVLILSSLLVFNFSITDGLASINILKSKCYDSDNGNEPFVQGIVKYKLLFWTGTYQDKCVNKNQLREYYCEKNKLKQAIHKCSNGCENGVCIQEVKKEQLCLLVTSGHEVNIGIYGNKGTPRLTDRDTCIKITIDYEKEIKENICLQEKGKLENAYIKWGDEVIVKSIVVDCRTDLSKIKCETYPNSDKINVETCRCSTNQYKRNIAVILKQGGIFDNNEVKNSIKSYLSEASKNLNLISSGIFMFSGETIEDLDRFIELIYSKNNVGYVIIAGDDFPIYQSAENLLKVSDLFSYVGSSFSSVSYSNALLGKCKDIAISLVPAPRGNNYLKTQFVKKTFDRFAELHAHYDREVGSYANSLLAIKWDPSEFSQCGEANLDFTFARDYYAMPKEILNNSEHLEIQRAFIEQPLALFYMIHGNNQSLGLGINPDNLSEACARVYTSIEQYKTFLTSNNTKSPLFVDSNSCGNAPIDWDHPESYLDQNGNKPATFCCWPQTFLDSGSWAVFRGSGGQQTMGSFIAYSTTKGTTLGVGILAIPHESFQIYGDILMHFPKNESK